MFFNPIAAGKFAEALITDDQEAAFQAALDLTAAEGLCKSAVLPAVEYNDTELGNLIQAKLQALTTATVAQAYGTIVPEITGFALAYLENLAHSEDPDDGKIDSQSEQQSSEESPTGS
jgi:hypothetical protein